MNITVSRADIMQELGINKDRMKYLTKNDKLNYELELIGYTIVDTYKQGRNTYYTLEQIEVDEWLQYQAYRNIRKAEDHTIWVENRLTNKGMKSPRKTLVNDLDLEISETTAKKYDDMLLEDDVMIKDRPVYMLFNPEKETFKEITEREYKDFWGDLAELKEQLAINKMRYNRREITEATYDSNKTVWINALGKDKGVIALKYDTYKEYINTIRVLDMIHKHRNKKLNRG